MCNNDTCVQFLRLSNNLFQHWFSHSKIFLKGLSDCIIFMCFCPLIFQSNEKEEGAAKKAVSAVSEKEVSELKDSKYQQKGTITLFYTSRQSKISKFSHKIQELLF